MERPDTPYVLAQTVIMQDFALRNAQSQIEELQRQMSEMAPPAQERPGSFLGGLFGRSPSPQPSTSSSGSVPRVNPWGNPDMPPPAMAGLPARARAMARLRAKAKATVRLPAKAMALRHKAR